MPVMPSIRCCTFWVSASLPARNPAVSLSIDASTVTSTVSLDRSASLFKWSSCSRAPCADAACGTSNASRSTEQLIVFRGFIPGNLLNSGLCRRNGLACDLQRQDHILCRLLRVRLRFEGPALLLLLQVVGRAESEHQGRGDRQQYLALAPHGRAYVSGFAGCDSR